MKRAYLSCLFVTVLLIAGECAFAQGARDSRKASLYDRIGGSDAVGKIFDEVGGRMAADPLLAKFFQGQSQEALMAQRKQTIDFLCHEMGGPCPYNGRSVKQAHGPLAINEDQWKAFVKHLSDTLDNQKVGAKEKSELLAIVKKFKPDVVTK
jgi:hemoglobin